MKVVICDDERDIRLLYRTAFEANGTTVAVARNGTECIDLTEHFRPSVVVLDLMMPGRDGFSALEEIHRRWPDVHVVVVSAYASPGNTHRAASLGADRCFDKLEFLGRIPRLIAEYEPAA